MIIQNRLMFKAVNKDGEFYLTGNYIDNRVIVTLLENLSLKGRGSNVNLQGMNERLSKVGIQQLFPDLLAL